MTVIFSVARLTFTLSMPGTRPRIFSITATHDAQVMPTMANCSVTGRAGAPLVPFVSGACDSMGFSVSMWVADYSTTSWPETICIWQ